MTEIRIPRAKKPYGPTDKGQEAKFKFRSTREAKIRERKLNTPTGAAPGRSKAPAKEGSVHKAESSRFQPTSVRSKASKARQKGTRGAAQQNPVAAASGSGYKRQGLVKRQKVGGR